MLEVASESFFKYVLPLIKEQFPEIHQRILVNISSSVAYGVADKYSDLDTFIIFVRHKDYIKYANRLETAINTIKFPVEYQNLCDKGVRFELESLKRSDVSKLYFRPTEENWMSQTDWLMYWFLNSETIYDPKGIKKRFEKKFSFYPNDITTNKIYLAFLAILINHQSFKQMSDGTDTISYYQLKYIFKILSRVLDIFYWKNNSYTPHPKWKYKLAILKQDELEHRNLSQGINNILNAVQFTPRYILDHMEQLIEEIENKIILSTKDDKNSENHLPDLIVESVSNTDLLVKNHISYPQLTKLCRMINDENKILISHELGFSHLTRPGYSYDISMRISDQLRYLVLSGTDTLKFGKYKLSESPNILKKRMLYYNFILWRKIRVVEKSIKRHNLFNYLWYSLQVIEHILELFFRLENQFFPVDEDIQQQCDNLKQAYPDVSFIFWKILCGNDVTNYLLNNKSEFVNLCWEIYKMLQKRMLDNAYISQTDAENPLETQFVIEYWKYENLFL